MFTHILDAVKIVVLCSDGRYIIVSETCIFARHSLSIRFEANLRGNPSFFSEGHRSPKVASDNCARLYGGCLKRQELLTIRGFGEVLIF